MTSLFKYIPQVVMNIKRKSTTGWSIGNVLLDFIGGSLSMFQSIFDSWLNDNWEGLTGNWVKMGLGVCSLVFDLVFVLQHYVIYRERSSQNNDELYISIDNESQDERY